MIGLFIVVDIMRGLVLLLVDYFVILCKYKNLDIL